MPQVVQDGAEVRGVPVDQVGSRLVLREHKSWREKHAMKPSLKSGRQLSLALQSGQENRQRDVSAAIL